MPAGADVARPFGDDRLDALADRYFSDRWRLDPISATRAGIHEHDAELGSFDEAAFGERVAVARRYLAELDTIEPGTMGAEAVDDAQILRAELQTEILRDGSLQPWRHHPDYYTERAATAVGELLARDFAPLAVRVRAVVARERGIPAMLDAARLNLTSVDAASAELARDNVNGAIAFFELAVPSAVSVRDAGLQREFDAANAATVAALRAYRSALEAGPLAHPSGTFAIGAAGFAELLRLQQLAPLSTADYERAGEAALAQTKAEFLEAAREVDAGKTPQALLAGPAQALPASEDVLATARRDVAALRAFVAERGLLTLAPGGDVSVVPMPAYARHRSLAVLNAPGPLESKATGSFYEIALPEPDWPPERKARYLARFNEYAFPLIDAHEVVPGHFAAFEIVRRERLSTIRRLLPNVAFVEGWAHYAEQMVVDEGWGNRNPRVRLAQQQAALTRECRYLVGLWEHTRGMSVERAVRFFEENAYVNEETARFEALRGTADPLYGYYTLGKLEILKMRADYRKVAGPRFTLGAFHDRLLAEGFPPMSIARKDVLAADDDGKLL